ncbi:STAS domain-containing protein [Thiolapillus sp.]|uniref:STAS domain-containing protein n=1 Tax=Thiolapillus sp. TaxID=2017437 RepID=UPI003AF72B1F
MTGSSTSLHLDPHLELDKLPELAQKLRESLMQDDAPLVLDDSGIQSIDGAAIQLLQLAVQTAKEKKALQQNLWVNSGSGKAPSA